MLTNKTVNRLEEKKAVKSIILSNCLILIVICIDCFLLVMFSVDGVPALKQRHVPFASHIQHPSVPGCGSFGGNTTH